MNGSFDQFPAGVRSIVEFKHDRERPLCSLYIEWLFGPQKKKVRKYSKFIDLRTKKDHPNQFYLFRAPGFFTNTLPRPTGFGDNFLPNMFLVSGNPDYTFWDFRGTPDNVAIQGIAFYYLKILPLARQRFVHMNRSIIKHDLDEKIELVPQFLVDLARFIHSTPDDALGVSLLNYVSKDELRNHITTLVFDSRAKRLEFYDSNGLGSTGDGVKNPAIEVYASISSPLAMQFFSSIEGNRRVCRTWANTLKVQDCMMDCALWANVSAICRMSGISREQLPIKTSDQRAIMSVLRDIMWTDCKLSEYGERFFKRKEIDHTLHSCQVPAEKKEKLLGLVMKQATKLPIPIPPDREICYLAAEPPKCNRVTLNVQEVDIHGTFLRYVEALCGLTHVTVLLPDIATYSESLDTIIDWMDNIGTLILKLPTPVNLTRDKATRDTLKTLVKANPNVVVMLDERRISEDMDLDSAFPSWEPQDSPVYSPTAPSRDLSWNDSPVYLPTAPSSPPTLDLSLNLQDSPAYSPTAPSYSRPSPPALDLSSERPYRAHPYREQRSKDLTFYRRPTSRRDIDRWRLERPYYERRR